MTKNKNPKLYELNEYGELTVKRHEKKKKKATSWQARFLVMMIILLLSLLF